MESEGISVLIPVYNYNVSKLADSLLSQFILLKIPFEIRVYDDGSNFNFKEQHRTALKKDGVVYQEIPQNIGRAAIRNKLAKEALYKNLLFLDCDDEIIKEDYIAQYLSILQHYEVATGGVRYQDVPPHNKEFQLHWMAGKFREEFTPEQMEETYYFPLKNIFIKKSVFLNTLLDDSLLQYGHEDTLFGQMLKEKGVVIKHLDNPVLHAGLNRTTDFLKKTILAVENLAYLNKTGSFRLTTKLTSTADLLKKWRVTSIVYYTLKCVEPLIKKNLVSHRPNLFLFDLFKLFHYMLV